MNDLKRYYIELNEEHISLISKLNISKLEKKNGKISFNIDHDSFVSLQKSLPQLTYRDRYKTKIKYLFTRRIISIIGIFLLIIILINQSFTITQVEFIDKDLYDEKVLSYLDYFYRKIGPFKYLNASISDINHQLRKEFFEYEWIGLKKEGTFLYIDIKKLDVKDHQFIDDGRVGDLIASKDAIVRYYYAQKGVLLVQELQSVSAGEILITGNVKVHNNELKYIKPIGFVVGEVLEYYNYSIPKEEIFQTKTGRFEERNIFYIGKKDIIKTGKDYHFEDYSENIDTIFNFFNLLKLNKVSKTEQVITINTYTKQEAIEYAKTLVERDFNSKKTNEFERIVFIELMKVIEGNNKYEIMLIVKKLENIAVFQEVNIQ